MRATATLLLTLVCATSTASAEESRIVRGSQIRLSDLVVDLPVGVPDVDLGSAPPPGSSRLLSKNDLESAARKSGVSLRLVKLPAPLRVISAAKRWSSDELVAAALPVLTSNLPSGVSVKKVKTSAKVVTTPDAAVSAVRLPKLPRREGEHMTTGVIELSSDGEIVARIPLSLTLEIDAAAAVAAITKGARVQLMIESGPARISAMAIAMSDGEIGETLQFRVAATQKVLYGKVLDQATARVVQ